MERALWVIGKTLSTAFSVLDASRIDSHDAKPFSNEELDKIAEEINANCSGVTLDSIHHIMTRINQRPDGRYCEKMDCCFYNMFIPNKCNECVDNLKSGKIFSNFKKDE